MNTYNHKSNYTRNILINIRVIKLVYLFNRLQLIKICSCCFLLINLYSNNLSTIATISLLIMSELFPACFSCSGNFNLSQSSLESENKNNVFETPQAETTKLGDSSNFIRVLSLVDFLPAGFRSKFFSSAKSYINFLSAKQARLTLYLLLVIISKRSPVSSNFFPVSRKVNILPYKVIGIVFFINKSFTLSSYDL